MSDKTQFTIHEDANQFERKTDPKFTKHVKGFGKPDFTNVDTYYLIQEATKEYGLYGKGFGLKSINYEHMTLPDGTILAILHGVFFFKDGEFPITNSDKLLYEVKAKTYQGKETPAYMKLDEEIYKKLETNTIGKALSRIGFGSDIYMGKFEDQAYVNEAIGESSISLEQVQQLTPLITATKTDIVAFNKAYGIGKLSELKQEDFQKALAQLRTKQAKQKDENN